MQDDRIFPIEFAMESGRISRRQAIAWARDGVFVPSHGCAYDVRPYLFFYSYSDLVALRMIGFLRQQFGLSLQSALKASDYIRSNSDTPWSELRFWILDKTVCLVDQASEAAVKIEVAPIAADVKEEADKRWFRNSDDFGRIEYRRDVMGGTLVVKGTRISVATVANLLAYGWDIDQIRGGYPTLQPEDIRGVMQYVEEQRKVA